MTGTADYGELEFLVRRHVLARLAEQAASVIPTGHLTQEVFGCVRVTVGPGRVELAGTNMERTVWAETGSVSTVDTGRFYLPARKLRAILAEAADGDVRVAVRGSQAAVTAAGDSWTQKLPPSDRYPELLDLSAVEFGKVSRKELIGALGTVRHAVGKDTGRPQYAQVSVAATRGPVSAVTVSAWDSAQFARAPLPSFPFVCGIPASVLDDLAKLLAASPDEHAEAGQTEGALAFRVGPVTLAVLKITKAFPDADKLVLGPARANDQELAVEDRAELLQAIRRVRINADPETSAIGLELAAGQLTLMARDKRENAAVAAVAAAWPGEPRKLVVNGRFLYDMVEACPAATCVFRIGADAGKQRPQLLLADEAAGVYLVIPQMPPSVVGY
jgi:DNA polymerase III sliding clamp (beta) subunit (PCNA family)